MSSQQELHERLADSLDPGDAASLAEDLDRAGVAAPVLELLTELDDASIRVGREARDALVWVRRETGLTHVVPWLDLGVAIAAASGAAGIRYFRESPRLIKIMGGGDVVTAMLTLALELAESDANVALEFFRQAPELVTVLPVEQVGRWAEIAADLAKADYVLGIEFLRQSPKVATVLPLDQVRPWVRFGMKLVTRNSLGKTDYFGTLEFFRTSSGILEDIDAGSLRSLVVSLGDQLAEQDPPAAIQFLADAPSLLRLLPSEAWAQRVLQYGLLIAERHAGAALAYVRRCPELLTLLGGPEADRAKFDEWFRSGMEVLAYSPEGAQAYFSLETRKALASVEQALSGVTLRSMARALKLFVQGLCASDVAIESIAGTGDAGETAKPVPRARVSADGRTIGLPAVLRRYGTREENTRLYIVMAAHEAGHLEFGTYRVGLDRLTDLVDEVRARYGHARATAVSSLAQAFELYPQPALIRDLWTVLEDARVEESLRREYPGLRADLEALAKQAVATRSLSHGMSVREMVVDGLLLLTSGQAEAVRVPEALRDILDRAWGVAREVLRPGASAEDAVRLAHRIYVSLEQGMTGEAEHDAPSDEPAPDAQAGPPASEMTTGQYRPLSNWTHRGEMRPELIRQQGQGAGDQQADADASEPVEEEPAAAERPRGEQAGDRPAGERARDEAGETAVAMAVPSSVADQLLRVEDQRQGAPLIEERARGQFVYDEWDGVIQDYRTGWCRVVERPAKEGPSDFADRVLADHGPLVRLLRRYFESIRPEGLRRLHGQPDGDDLDLDAAIRRRSAQVAGAEPSDRIYLRRERRERDVAVAFLVDLSGSTSRAVDAEGRRVIEVEKEGLVLLTQALDAIGDQYAVYGYSGKGRRQVDFLVLKEFDEGARGRAMNRIGAAAPMHQNRDGAAIRHAVRKLQARPAKVRLLVLISDGKPLDDGYADEYSLEDTKMALREARMRGIEPFCITVDRTADDYLRRMYGEVRYLIIDRVTSLPERLPRIYQRLTA